jgi:hypothetical protein
MGRFDRAVRRGPSKRQRSINEPPAGSGNPKEEEIKSKKKKKGIGE